MLAVALLQENSQYSVIVERSLQFAEDAFRLLRSDGQQSLDVCNLVTAVTASCNLLIAVVAASRRCSAADAVYC